MSSHQPVVEMEMRPKVTAPIVFVDLSSIAYPIWHMSQSDPNPDHASVQIVSRVRAIASNQPNVAICCDSGRSFRHDIASDYKANRAPKEAMLMHQIDLAIDTLKADGFPIWRVRGFEADDLIATACAKALETTDRPVLVVSGDKDLLQLVAPRVAFKSVNNGDLIDADGVRAKFGVTPGQMRDFLTLCGDTSDNVKGAKGIGPKRAAELLDKFGSLDGIYEQLRTAPVAMGLTVSTRTALLEFHGQHETTRQLITLRTDVDLPFETVLAERTPIEPAGFAEDTMTEETENAQPETEQPATESTEPSKPTQALTVAPQADVLPAPAEWERQLDPRSLRDARVLSEDMFKSRMFSAYGSMQGVLSTIMVGRELGMPAMASLRSIHVIEGRHSLSASLMVALVLKSGLAEFFEPLEFDDTKATFETKRIGARNPIKLTYTIEMAIKAKLVKPDSNWQKNPMALCIARSQSMLCRIGYPDLLAGLYTPEELDEIRQGVA